MGICSIRVYAMMKAAFDAKYRDNAIVVSVAGEEVSIPFTLRYGVNVVPLSYGGRTVDMTFVSKFGRNEVDLPITIHDTIYLDNAVGLSDLNTGVYTLINQIPASAESAAKTTWKKHYLPQCSKQYGLYDKSKEAMVYDANAFTVFCKNWQDYRRPLFVDGGYYALADAEQDKYFTVKPKDLIIFAKIDDPAPTSTAEFIALKNKYADLGGEVTGAEVYIHYRPNGEPWKTNHIEIIKG